MMTRRYVSIMIDEELIIRWELGFYALGRELARHIALHSLTEWPELVHAEREAYGWKLVFAWPERNELR
jgi:hypothetical protein